MSFDSRERSLQAGQPVRLYLFERGALRWAYTAADRRIAFQSAVYESVPISDDGIRMTGEASADEIKVTAPADIGPASLFRHTPPAAEVWLTVRDYHYGEADVTGSALVVWIGSIGTVRWPRQDRCEIACQSLGASLKRPGLRLTWERTCPHTIYDLNCRVSRVPYRVNAPVQSMTGVAVSSAAFDGYPDGWFAGGYIEFPIGAGEVDRRGIEQHTGAELVVIGGTAGLAVGDVVSAYPGCAQTMDVCDSKFGNKDNYGGVRHLPGKSPFDGDPVF